MNDDPDALRRAADRLAYEFGVEVAKQVLRDLGAVSAERYLVASARARLCRQLLDQQVPRSSVRDRLIRAGMSERSAYRLIDSVLCQRGDELARALAKMGR